MYYIISKKNSTIHREPGRPTYGQRVYKTASAAKAGITRTIRYYQNAIDDVAEVMAKGKPDYHSRWYNAYRDATDPVLGRTHCFDKNNFEVVAVSDYVEPQITRTGRRPYDGKEITVTMGINEIGGCTDPLTETYWSM